LLTYEAIEDESDGYRSYLGSVETVNCAGLIFFSYPVATIRIEDVNEDSETGYQFRDVEDNHIWLRFGTDNADDYYPYFVFQYSAKASGPN